MLADPLTSAAPRGARVPRSTCSSVALALGIATTDPTEVLRESDPVTSPGTGLEAATSDGEPEPTERTNVATGADDAMQGPTSLTHEDEDKKGERGRKRGRKPTTETSTTAKVCPQAMEEAVPAISKGSLREPIVTSEQPTAARQAIAPEQPTPVAIAPGQATAAVVARIPGEPIAAPEQVTAAVVKRQGEVEQGTDQEMDAHNKEHSIIQQGDHTARRRPRPDAKEELREGEPVIPPKGPNTETLSQISADSVDPVKLRRSSRRRKRKVLSSPEGACAVPRAVRARTVSKRQSGHVSTKPSSRLMLLHEALSMTAKSRGSDAAREALFGNPDGRPKESRARLLAKLDASNLRFHHMFRQIQRTDPGSATAPAQLKELRVLRQRFGSALIALEQMVDIRIQLNRSHGEDKPTKRGPSVDPCSRISSAALPTHPSSPLPSARASSPSSPPSSPSPLSPAPPLCAIPAWMTNVKQEAASTVLPAEHSSEQWISHGDSAAQPATHGDDHVGDSIKCEHGRTPSARQQKNGTTSGDGVGHGRRTRGHASSGAEMCEDEHALIRAALRDGHTFRLDGKDVPLSLLDDPAFLSIF